MSYFSSNTRPFKIGKLLKQFGRGFFTIEIKVCIKSTIIPILWPWYSAIKIVSKPLEVVFLWPGKRDERK